MEPVGLGNTRILTDDAQKYSKTLLVITLGKPTNEVHNIIEHLVLVQWVLET
jgi:hypothetical protein